MIVDPVSQHYAEPSSLITNNSNPAFDMIGRYPKLVELRKYWSLVVIVPENQF